MAAAAFRGDRVAPPIFGTLADGLKRTNAADGASSVVPSAPPRTPVGPRPPKLAAVLAGGSGVIERGAMTSVSDGTQKRRPAPSIDSVRTRLTRQLPVQLTRSARPGVSDAGTIIAAGAVPFTSAAGTARSVSIGRTGSALALGTVIGGLGKTRLGARRGATTASTIHAGDLVVLHSVDAPTDLDAQNRPMFTVTGQTRVTMTASDGTVLADAMVRESIVVPPSTAIIGVHAGGDTAVKDGLAGWHERSRMARLNARVAVGPGCALKMEGVVTEAPPAWLTAAELIVQATSITTRFVDAARTVVVVLAGSETPTPDDVTIELDGATRVADRKGNVREPRVVMIGDRTALIYDVKPAKTGNVSVFVQPGGQWRLAGVLGGDVDSETLARNIAMKGIASVAGRLMLAADGAPVSVNWEPPPVVVLPGPVGIARKKAAVRKSSAKKSARKTSARKTAPRKTSTRKTTAKKRATKKAVPKKRAATTRTAATTKRIPGKRGSPKRAATTRSVATTKRAAQTRATAKRSTKKTTTTRGGARNAR